MQKASPLFFSSITVDCTSSFCSDNTTGFQPCTYFSHSIILIYQFDWAIELFLHACKSEISLPHPMERTEWVSGYMVLSWQLGSTHLTSVIFGAYFCWCIVKITWLSSFKALYHTTLPTPKRKNTYCKCHSGNANCLALTQKNASEVFELLDCRMDLLLGQGLFLSHIREVLVWLSVACAGIQ